MYSKLQLVRKYLSYKLKGSNTKGHGIHSPFVFEFVTKILQDKRQYNCYQPVENLRKRLQKDKTVLTVKDFGAGSRVNSQNQRTVQSIAHSALKPAKFGQLLFRMINYYQPSTILELGTSLGITTAYLASSNSSNKVITMEGSEAVADIAQQNFSSLELHNIKIVKGNFDETLYPTLAEIETVDFAFIDGNHRKQPTLDYFNQLLPKSTNNSFFVFDDIHWSQEMEEAWQEIIQHSSVMLSIDLFFIGIVWFKKESLKKQHFTIKF